MIKILAGNKTSNIPRPQSNTEHFKLVKSSNNESATLEY